MFNLYDVVKLKASREDIGVSNTDIGTIIDYVEKENVYSVEFIDSNGETIEDSIYEYFSPDELELVK